MTQTSPATRAVSNRVESPVNQPDSKLVASQNIILGLCAVLFALVYLCLWPRINTTMDESSYLGFAYVMRHGSIYADRVSAPILLALSVHGHLVSKYPLGMSALLALTSLLGWTFALGTNLFVHVASYAAVIRLLRRFSLSPYYAILYLLHPTAVLYSRTVMSDLASGLVLVLAFEQYLSRRFLIVGALLGLSILFRTANAVALPLFLMGVLIEPEDYNGSSSKTMTQKLVLALRILAGALPFLALAGYYSQVIAAGQMAKSTGSFGLMYFPKYFPGYVLALLVIYPGMLIAPALYRGRGKFIQWSLCYSFVIIYSFWYFRDEGGNLAESLIVGQRYFLAVLPLFVLAYGMMLDRLARRIRGSIVRSAIAVVAVAAMGLVSIFVQRRHEARLHQMILMRDALIAVTTPDDLIYCNTQVAKLLAPWNDRRFVQPAADLTDDRIAVTRWFESHQSDSGSASVRSRVIFASWVRDGREDDQRGGAQIEALSRAFTTAPVPTPLAPGLHVRYIIEKHGANLHTAPKVNLPVSVARKPF